MTGYTKLFGSIVASTIWREPHETRIVWITMLAMANKGGVVESSLPGLADLARVSIPECQVALAALEAPDEYSRTKDYEGRRIEACDGGWHVLNHAKYRAKMGADERREYMRLKQQEHRDKKKGASKPRKTRVNNRQHLSMTVNDCHSESTESTHAEAQSDAEANTESEEDNVAGGGSVYSKFVEGWMKYYEERTKSKYSFTGRDGKAVNQLLAHFKEVDELKKFIGKCHKRAGDGYPFNSCETLYDLANNISKLQAALAQPSKSEPVLPKPRANPHLSGVRIVHE